MNLLAFCNLFYILSSLAVCGWYQNGGLDRLYVFKVSEEGSDKCLNDYWPGQLSPDGNVELII